MTRYASIDIGSNTAMLLVVEPSETGWQTVCDELRMPRLARGLDGRGDIDDASRERAAVACRAYRERLRALGVPPEQTVATGTAPFRRAANGAAVAAMLTDALGVPIDVVTGEQEAELSALATTTSFPDRDPLLVVDIGGASTELTTLCGGSMTTSVSLDVGAVRLHERCVASDPPTDAERRALEAEIERALGAAPLELIPGSTLVGIAGTVTTAASMKLELVDGYDAEAVHGSVLERAAVEALRDRLGASTVAERRRMAGLAAERADVIYAGVALLAAILRHARQDTCLVSDRGTRWGGLYRAFGNGIRTPEDSR